LPEVGQSALGPLTHWARQVTLPPAADARLLALAILTADNQHDTETAALANNIERHSRVIGLVAKTYNPLPEPLRTQALRMLDRLVQVDAEYEIALLPHFFADAYRSDAPAISEGLLDHLGAANVHTWLAYTIYDDFLDDEGQPPLLPVANVALRAAAESYRQILADDTAFQAEVSAAFVAVDAANSWETKYWRFAVSEHNVTIGTIPNYGNRQLLADRALLHIMGPLAVLATSGSQPGDAVWRQCSDGLRHYLIARQLTDDLHDWVKDLRAGHTSYIVSEILRSLALPNGMYRFKQLLPMAREQFWQRSLFRLCETTTEHIHLARQGLAPYIATEHNQLFFFLDTLETAMQTALAEQKQGSDFLTGLS
jgi:hypothetical protein